MISEASEINLKDPNGYFQDLAKNFSEIIILIDPASFKLTYINHVQDGFNLQDVLGANVLDFVFPEHVEHYRKTLNECLETKQTKTIELETTDTINENGKAWYRCTISPIISDQKIVQNLLVISKNITNDKLHDIELYNKKEKLYAIINNSNDIILSIDRNYCLTEYNSVFGDVVKRGFGKTELNGHLILDYIDPIKHDHLRSIYERVFSGETVNDIESFQIPSGVHVYFESSYHPIYNYEKRIIGISIFSKNITERVLNEQKVIKALKDKDVLLAEIHHRIKNNLALVSSMLQLKEMNLENDAAKEALSDSRKRIKSTALVHEMLYRDESFDNVKLIQYIKELFSNLNVNSNIQLDLEGEDHVFDLNKALPFGLMLQDGEQGKLLIRSAYKEGNLKVQYCDCRGVFPDHIDFTDTSTTGLMLIHTFAEQLNGSIKLVGKTPPSYEIIIPIS
jgi:PAS domain S-box-containing protein